jgi:hypothetical protein
MPKFKQVITSLVLSGLLVSTAASAGGHYRYGHHHYHGGHWVAPALIGGLVVYSVMQPRVVHAQPVYVTPAPVVVAPPPPQPIQAQNLPPVWYYCQSSQTYYPYVQSCQEGWKTVPTTPS